MTVVAWDGRTLAADKRATGAGMKSTATKIHRLPDGLVGFSGGGAHAAELLNWFFGARNPDTYPRRDDDEGAGSLMINSAGAVFMYSANSPFPERIEDPFFARGSGRDYAMAAMHLGCDSRRAVEVACAFDVYCGNGIDTLELE
jgi:ATP-dependent protease HslVU (ClpYQ) peptidase subunit